MLATTRIYTFLFVLITLTSGNAQSYELDWSQINESPASKSKNYTLNWDSVGKHVDRAAPPAEIEAPKVVVARFQDRFLEEKLARSVETKIDKKVRPQPQVKQTYNLELSTSQYYDTYASRYLKVETVEVTTYKKGSYPGFQILENRGQWNTYPVYLNDLEEGDRIKVRVVWDDGSNRTIEKSVNRHLGHTIYVGEPDYLAYTAW